MDKSQPSLPSSSFPPQSNQEIKKPFQTTHCAARRRRHRLRPRIPTTSMKHPSSATTATVLLLLTLLGVAAVGGQDGQKRAAGVYIVIVQPPADGADTVAYHTCILAAALGSEERAKEALLYSYRTVASGFAAKLTPPELAALQEHPAVLQVRPDQMYHVVDNLN
uniref:Inhibitor I9 domain-containing protein n=1 Tax=Oryza meridionalis TaxID=40149 RepID=A0A0E0EAN4_9ORYZ